MTKSISTPLLWLFNAHGIGPIAKDGIHLYFFYNKNGFFKKKKLQRHSVRPGISTALAGMIFRHPFAAVFGFTKIK